MSRTDYTVKRAAALQCIRDIRTALRSAHYRRSYGHTAARLVREHRRALAGLRATYY